jgi:hypothetical protein
LPVDENEIPLVTHRFRVEMSGYVSCITAAALAAVT